MFKLITRFITKHYAPYAVQYVPSNLFEDEQTIYCWTMGEAIQWAACSLRSDRVYIIRRACLVQRGALMATRSVTQEVTR
jgi:hypothetical protein